MMTRIKGLKGMPRPCSRCGRRIARPDSPRQRICYWCNKKITRQRIMVMKKTKGNYRRYTMRIS